jgi:hypothetical protein
MKVRQYNLQSLTYRQMREDFGLTAQAAIRCLAKAGDAYAAARGGIARRASAPKQLAVPTLLFNDGRVIYAVHTSPDGGRLADMEASMSASLTIKQGRGFNVC